MIEIGIFGGTFDPIHVGHLAVARCLSKSFALEKVYFLTNASPPHKTGVLDAEERHCMVSLALSDHPDFEAAHDDLERTTAHELDTLKALKKRLDEGVRLNLITSSEYLEPGIKWNIASWDGAGELFKLVRILVAPRGDVPVEQIREWAKLLNGATVEVAESCPSIPVSSRLIRRLVKDGKEIDNLVSPAVLAHIAGKGLYRATT